MAGLEKEKPLPPPPPPPPPPNEKEGVEVPPLLAALPKENKGAAAGGFAPVPLSPPKAKIGVEVVAGWVAAAVDPRVLPNAKLPVEL